MRHVVAILGVTCVIGCSSGRQGGTPGTVGTGGSVDSGTSQAGSADGGTVPTTGGAEVVYGHSASTLYSIDPTTLAVTKIADFGWPGFGDAMTDIALDKVGNMTGISESTIYSVSATTGACKKLSDFSGDGFNGLSFISADQTTSGAEILVGANQDGDVVQIDPSTGTQTTIGNYGGGWVSSGDLVSVEGATYATVTNGSGNDRLAKVDPMTGEATIIGTTSVSSIYGLAYWKQKLYGFTDQDGMVTIDVTTGKSTPAPSGNGVEWYGAGVTTSAPTTIN
jgi:hypothetical protein